MATQITDVSSILEKHGVKPTPEVVEAIEKDLDFIVGNMTGNISCEMHECRYYAKGRCIVWHMKDTLRIKREMTPKRDPEWGEPVCIAFCSCFQKERSML